jgi:hypothetical protein
MITEILIRRSKVHPNREGNRAKGTNGIIIQGGLKKEKIKYGDLPDSRRSVAGLYVRIQSIGSGKAK